MDNNYTEQRKQALLLIPIQEIIVFLKEWGIFVSELEMTTILHSCIPEQEVGGLRYDGGGYYIKFYCNTSDSVSRMSFRVEIKFTHSKPPGCRGRSRWHYPHVLKYIIDFKNEIFRRY